MIKMKRLNDAVHFVATNEEGNSIHMDGSAKIGGEGKGVRPMETVLMAIAGCSSIDIVMILKKMRQNLEDIEVEVNGEKVETIPQVFKTIHIKYILTGNLKEEKVAEAVRLSMEKYCSVSKMIEKAAEITYEYEIKPGNEV